MRHEYLRRRAETTALIFKEYGGHGAEVEAQMAAQALACFEAGLVTDAPPVRDSTPDQTDREGGSKV